MANGGSPDWKPEVTFRGDPMDIAWPAGWGVVTRGDGSCVARPSYAVRDPLAELEQICAWLEQSTVKLDDAEIRMTCGDAEFEDGWFGWNSFKIPGHYLTRLRALGVRLVICFEPPFVERIES